MALSFRTDDAEIKAGNHSHTRSTSKQNSRKVTCVRVHYKIQQTPTPRPRPFRQRYRSTIASEPDNSSEIVNENFRRLEKLRQFVCVCTMKERSSPCQTICDPYIQPPLNPKADIFAPPRIRGIQNRPVEILHQLKENFVKFQKRNPLTQTAIFPIPENQITYLLHLLPLLRGCFKPPFGSEDVTVLTIDIFKSQNSPGI